MKKTGILVFCLFVSYSSLNVAQETYNLQSCIKYALENNHNIRKSQFDLEKSMQARREVLGALLPQMNSTGSLNYNIQKSKFIMPNFINSMLPPAMQDPAAPEYMTIEMGMNYSSSIGATLNQQLINFSLFNTLDITRTAESLTALGVEAKEEDVIAQTAGLFYAVQVTDFAMQLFGRSVSIIDTMLNTMEASYANGLVKKVDLDRLKVTRTNLATQQAAMKNAVQVQKNLLKLQMGVDVNSPLELQSIDMTFFEARSGDNFTADFDLSKQTSYKIISTQADLTALQRRGAVYESLPVMTAMLSYSYNGVCDEFFRGETNYWYPNSMAALSLKIPIFSGFSRSAKIRQAEAEMKKIKEDSESLGQSLNMAFNNAVLKLEDSRRTIKMQQDNMALAEEVSRITEGNYSHGLASMSDVLNASNSLIQSQMSYADALNNFMKAWIDLKKTSGTVRELAD